MYILAQLRVFKLPGKALTMIYRVLRNKKTNRTAGTEVDCEMRPARRTWGLHELVGVSPLIGTDLLVFSRHIHRVPSERSSFDTFCKTESVSPSVIWRIHNIDSEHGGLYVYSSTGSSIQIHL